jgi:MipA family protein
MRITSTATATFTLTTAVLLPLAAPHAQPQGQPQQGDSVVMLGAGVAVTPRYAGSSAYQTLALPYVIAETSLAPQHKVYLRGLNAGYEYQLSDRISVGLDGTYRMERDSSDDAELAGMADVDGTIEVGPRVRLQLNEQVGLEGRLHADVGGEHKGYETYLGGDVRQPVNVLGTPLMLEANLGATYGSKKLNNTYFGVPGSAARADRPAYLPGAGWQSVNTGVAATYAVTPNWSLRGGVSADYLIGDVADSPLVEEQFQPTVMLGALYRF